MKLLPLSHILNWAESENLDWARSLQIGRSLRELADKQYMYPIAIKQIQVRLEWKKSSKIFRKKYLCYYNREIRLLFTLSE